MLSNSLVVLILVSVAAAGKLTKRYYGATCGTFDWDERRYLPGEQFVPDSCGYVCTCTVVEENYAVFLCERLCPRYHDYICPKGTYSKLNHLPAGPPESRCMCDYLSCESGYNIVESRLSKRRRTK